MPWIRFDTAIMVDDFCVDLTGDEFKAWAILLLAVKSYGGRGTMTEISNKRLAAMAGVPEEAVKTMFAKAGDRFSVVDGRIIVRNWAKYQEDHRENHHGRKGREISAPDALSEDAIGAVGATTTTITTTTTPQQRKDKIGARTKNEARPASIEEVKQYVDELGGMPWEAEKWWDHFEGNGWKVGKAATPMKSWKATVRTWMRNAEQFSQGRNNGGSGKGRRIITNEDIERDAIRNTAPARRSGAGEGDSSDSS